MWKCYFFFFLDYIVVGKIRDHIINAVTCPLDSNEKKVSTNEKHVFFQSNLHEVLSIIIIKCTFRMCDNQLEDKYTHQNCYNDNQSKKLHGELT